MNTDKSLYIVLDAAAVLVFSLSRKKKKKKPGLS